MRFLTCVARVTGLVLSKTVKVKDLGVTMNANMKVSEQCRIAASKGNQVLGLKGHCISIEFKYYADGIHSGLTPPG